MSKYGKACLKHGKHFPNISGYQLSSGPASEGLSPEDFEPCSERKRNDKRPRPYSYVDGPHTRRSKRSESYTYPSMLWKDSSNIPYAIDSSILPAVKQNILTALRYWMGTTCVVMVQVNATGLKNTSHIVFSKKGG